MGGHRLHCALYSLLFLLKERQTGLVERGMCGQLLSGALYSFLLLLTERHTGLGERQGLVANSYMWPSTPFYSFQIERPTGMGEMDGVNGQLLHGAIYSFLLLLKERQTGLGLRGMGGPTPTLSHLLLSIPS